MNGENMRKILLTMVSLIAMSGSAFAEDAKKSDNAKTAPSLYDGLPVVDQDDLASVNFSGDANSCKLNADVDIGSDKVGRLSIFTDKRKYEIVYVIYDDEGHVTKSRNFDILDSEGKSLKSLLITLPTESNDIHMYGLPKKSKQASNLLTDIISIYANLNDGYLLIEDEKKMKKFKIEGSKPSAGKFIHCIQGD